jgi:ParB-like chromosome segregation protein Spo0J
MSGEVSTGMTVSIDVLLENPENLRRVKLANRQTVERYIRMNARTAAPPIVLDKNGSILDGIHRTAAALESGRPDIEAIDPLDKLRNEARKFGQWENGEWE